MIGPVGFAETISTWIRCARRRRPRAERVAGREDLPERLREPRVGDVEVDEAGRRRLRPLDETTLERRSDDLAGDVERRLPPRAREAERDVRRVVAVRRIARTLERDRDLRDLGERLLEAREGVDLHAGHATILGAAGAGVPR